MIVGKMIHAIDSHTAGMPTRVIVGGVPELSGSTMTEKARYFRDHFDYVRTALFQEPRGLLRGTGALMTSPTHPEAQLGVFFMDSTYPCIPMCGHGSIGVITVAIEFGMLETVEPVTEVVLDTPAGLVTCQARVQSGAVVSVSVQNVPSFLYTSKVIDIPHLGTVPVDVAFGGNFFAIVESEDIGVRVDKRNASRLSETAIVIRVAANAQIPVKHPKRPISSIDAVRICNKPTNSGKHIKNVVIFEEGDKGIDRSPCGTGTSAHLAALYAKGRIGMNEESIHESIIGTTFRARVVSQTSVNGFPAIIPEIRATAHTLGINTFILSPNDPVKHGFLID